MERPSDILFKNIKKFKVVDKRFVIVILKNNTGFANAKMCSIHSDTSPILMRFKESINKS